MKIKMIQKSWSIVLAVFLTISWWQNVKAWAYYSPLWSGSTHSYGYGASLPVSWWTYLDRGANAWTNVTPSHWVWNKSSPIDIWVYYSYIDGAGNAAGNTIQWTSITFDSSENWYVGSGVPGSNQIDAQSVATHELGHALRLAHTSGIYCPGNTNNATMCASGPTGSYYMRTLEGDDRNAINTLYP